MSLLPYKFNTEFVTNYKHFVPVHLPLVHIVDITPLLNMGLCLLFHMSTLLLDTLRLSLLDLPYEFTTLLLLRYPRNLDRTYRPTYQNNYL